MTVPAIGLYSGIVPNPNTQSAEDFSTNAVDWTNYQANTLGVDINASIEQFNIDFVTVNDNTVSAAASAAESAVSAAESAASALTSQSLANFKGRWSDATGAATVPSAYSNNGQSWQLLQDIADITADEPVDGAPNWKVINDINLSNVQYDLINNPISHFFGVNKIVEKMAVGTTFKSTRPSGATLVDMYKSTRQVLNDVPREQSGGFMAEPLGTNLLLWSEDFTNGVWIPLDCGVIPSAATPPVVGATADKLVPTATNSQHIQRQNVAHTAGSLTSSIIAAQGEFTTAHFDLWNATDGVVANCDIDLITGAVISNMFGVVNVEKRKGWWHVALSGVVTTTSTQFRVYPKDSTVYLGDGVSGIYATAAQVENSSSATSYIKTEGATKTRAPDKFESEGFGNTPCFSKDFSFSCEFDFASVTSDTDRHLVNIDNEAFALRVAVGGQPQVVGAGGVTGGSSVLNKKVTLFVVFEGGVVAIFGDRTLLASGVNYFNVDNDNTLFIGQLFNGFFQANASMRNMRWYDRALTIDSIKTMVDNS